MMIVRQANLATNFRGVLERVSSLIKHKSYALNMIIGSAYKPKENKDRPLGEDAHFVCQEKNTIGVADGVGGWAKQGVDAGEYARQLMTNSLVALYNEPTGAVEPKRVLQQAYSRTHVKGSSTACIITLQGNFLLYANVGDSGFMVFREKRLLYRSPVQQSYFNCPYQLGLETGNPSLAYEAHVRVEEGDVVVAGTDGLFDNVYPSEIEEIMNRIAGRYLPTQLAWSITAVALANSVNKEYKSPFAVAALEEGHSYTGGKYDDITVVVAEIVLM